MSPESYRQIQTRRDFLNRCAGGIGTAALANLLASEGYANPAPHFAPKARNVIFLFMAGAPSQIDLFDPKPELAKWHGKALPMSLTKELKLAFTKPDAAVMASPWEFRKCGESGTEISTLLPRTQEITDDICLVRSMFSDQFNHHPGQSLLMSGHPLMGRPTLGAWLQYGLGSESKDLPGFVVMTSGVGTFGATSNWSSGFLPSSNQGVVFRSSGDPILYLSQPAEIDAGVQRRSLDALRDLNGMRQRDTGDAEIASRIASYELAFRMQSSAPELTNLSGESEHIHNMYGTRREATRQFATNCLLARRMVERGVRFVLIQHSDWDDHRELNKNLTKNCQITDGPAAALVKDLRQRGLLDSTLVVWGGEFGRTPMSEMARANDSASAGRDHHPNGYSMWLAGGGIKSGQVIGKTDELGLSVVEDKVTVHDLQATILHCLGLDHTRLTYRHMGRNFRLTDVEGAVVHKMIT